MNIAKGLLGLMLMGFCCRLTAQPIHIAVASNFTHTMQTLVLEFEKSSEQKVILSFGSSGKLYAQITQGAPFQLFFSADQLKPMLLEEQGLAVVASRFTYAIGRLALWSAIPDFIDDGLSILQQGRFKKLALANPRFAPYGMAAYEVLARHQLVRATQKKWVQGENISQTLQFVDSQNAQLGFVALSQLLGKHSARGGSKWLIPEHMHQPIKQDALLLNSGSASKGAKDFMAFVRSPKAQQIIKTAGYSIATNTLVHKPS
jgi:molybdate transport system substrate-binding protein